MTFASLIVSAWNRPELLIPFFQSLWANTFGGWVHDYCPGFTEDMEYRLRLCPMMRLLPVSRSTRYPPVEDNAAHWRAYKDTPWLGALDPPVVSYHPGNGLCSIGRARKTLKRGPHLLGGTS